MKPVKNNKLLAAMPIIGFFLIIISFVLKHLGVNAIACVALSGFGCAWVGIGLLDFLIKRINPAYAKKQEIDTQDERNIQIQTKASSVSFCVTLFALTALGFVFLILDNDLAWILTTCAIAVQIVSFFLAISHYNKKL